MLNKVLWLLKEHGVHTCYALFPTGGQFSEQKLRAECRCHVAKSAALLYLADAKGSIITSHGGITFHFCLSTERAKRAQLLVYIYSYIYSKLGIISFRVVCAALDGGLMADAL